MGNDARRNNGKEMEKKHKIIKEDVNKKKVRGKYEVRREMAKKREGKKKENGKERKEQQE